MIRDAITSADSDSDSRGHRRGPRTLADRRRHRRQHRNPLRGGRQSHPHRTWPTDRRRGRRRGRAPGVTPEMLATAAARLLQESSQLNVDELLKRARELRDELDEAGIAAREEAIYQQRSFRRVKRSNGVSRFILDPDLETGAYLDDLYDKSPPRVAADPDSSTPRTRPGPKPSRATNGAWTNTFTTASPHCCVWASTPIWATPARSSAPASLRSVCSPQQATSRASAPAPAPRRASGHRFPRSRAH